MTPTQNYVLFTAADAIYSFVPTRGDFEYHLLINLLFEEKLLMHEGYILNSRFLAEHIDDSLRGKSLFEIAAEIGLIVPAYRQEGTISLRVALKIMEDAHSKKTKLHLSTEKQMILDRLCECIDAGREVFYWPNEKLSMGESYQNLLFDKLRNENSIRHAIKNPIFFNDKKMHEILWEKSAKWRTRLLDEAASATIARGQTGIQRAEIFRLLAEDLKVEDVQDIKETHRYHDEAQAFLRWINHCHQLNTASFFGVAPNLLNYNFTEDFIANDFLSGTTTSTSDGAEPIQVTVPFPKWEILVKKIQEDPSHFWDLRHKGIGNDYLKSLKIWRINPTYLNREEMLNNLKEYCKSLCNYYLKGSKPNQLVIVLTETLNILKPFIPGAMLKTGANIVTKILGNSYKITNQTKTNIHLYHPLNR